MTPPNSSLILHALQGTWFIHYSDFPMWLKGNKKYPTFTYTVERRGGLVGLKDEVRYLKTNRPLSINGFDTPDATKPGSFVWRGDGLLAMLKSKWDVIYLAPAGDWAIIHFDKTLFTPEGYDVMARSGQLTEKVQQQIHEKLSELRIGVRMKRIPQK